MSTHPSTPRELGYRMPAEWEPHEATWIAWPHNEDDWPGKFGPIPWVYVEIVKQLHRVEPVRILVNDETTQKQAAKMLERAGVDGRRVAFYHVATDRVWIRDYGPIFVKDPDGAQAITNWEFNGWAKYDNWQNDNAVPDQIAEALGIAQWKPAWEGRPVVLEGGSIDVDGQGTLLTTEECLLSPVQQRNPRLTRGDLEHVFAEFLGIDKVIWLKQGIAGDDTHGHVDDIARFVDPTTVVLTGGSRENRGILLDATDSIGRRLRVFGLPMPRPLYFDDQRLPMSYANFYIANDLVLVPTFNDEADKEALATLSGLFPTSRVIGIYCGDLIWGLGALHCMTQQQPITGKHWH